MLLNIIEIITVGITAAKMDLASLRKGMLGLTPANGGTLAEAAAVCLELASHQQNVELSVTGTHDCIFKLQWESIDTQQRQCYNDIQEATELGACGIAILAINELTGLEVCERSRKGTGFDYWLGNISDDDDIVPPFPREVRLEVSGILNGDDSKIKSRVAQKKNQITRTDDLAPGYVAVIEFGRPIAHVELK